MKYIRSTEELLQRNIMAVQVDEQVFYKTVRDIRAGEEMLLYARDALYPEMELETMAMHPLDNESQTYPCSECGEVFRSKVALRRHQTYACPKTQSFLRNMTLSTSQDRVDSDGKSLDSENSVSGMEQEMGQEGEFKCDQCPKSFQWKSNLVRHQVTHDEDRRYPCENCDKVFTDPSNLQRHIRSQHVGARCHACSECGKTFATSSGLKQHQHIHSSVKPFQCEVCLKAYTQFSNLCRHKRMHADCRQQIKCKDCGQAFSTVTSLSKHKRFCEGALRSGMRLCYSQDKLSPMSLSPGGHPPPHFNPAYMGLYGPRPPYHPFFPPLGGPFPVLQPPLPHVLLGSASLSPSSLSYEPARLTKEKSSPTRSPSEDKERFKNGELNFDDNLSDASLGSEPDISSVSDEEENVIPSKRARVLEPGEIITSPFSFRHHLESSIKAPMKLPLKSSLLPHPLNVSNNAITTASDRAADNVSSEDVPFDLSRSVKKQEPPSPSSSVGPTTPSPKLSSAKDEMPLDLSKKTVQPTAEVLPVETPRKTHIYGGEIKPPIIPEPKYPFSASVGYPYPPPSALMESVFRLDKEKMSQTFQQEVAKFMAFPRFSLPGMPPAFNPLGLLRPDMDKALSTPMLKMEKSPEVTGRHSHPSPFSYASSAASTVAGGANKLKERYSCKFCGKIFPRSANLTRHLRTHTGEQPYKCKYCERSFSISSNLQRHVRNIHNKEKPFRCPLCDRSFGQQTNLDRHLKKHEQEGPNVADSPTAELDNKDEAYFSEIRNLVSKTPSDAGLEIKERLDVCRSPTNQQGLSDGDDEKESDLTIVDDDVDPDDVLTDDGDNNLGEELHLGSKILMPSPGLNNNKTSAKAGNSGFVANGLLLNDKHGENFVPNKNNYDVKASCTCP